MMSDVYFVSFIIESHLDAIRLEAIAIRSRFLEKLNTPFRWQYEPCKPFDQTLRQQRRSSHRGLLQRFALVLQAKIDKERLKVVYDTGTVVS